MGRPFLHDNEAYTIGGDVDGVEDGCILDDVTRLLDARQGTHVCSDSWDRAAVERKRCVAHSALLYSTDGRP